MYGAFRVGGTEGGGYENTPESFGSPLGAAPSREGRADDVSAGGAASEIVSELGGPVGVIVVFLLVFEGRANVLSEETVADTVSGVDAVFEGVDAD
jgi:hypothetical protein